MANDDEVLLKFKADIEGLKSELKEFSGDAKKGFKQIKDENEKLDKSLHKVSDTVKNKLSHTFAELKHTVVGAFAVHSIVHFTEKLFELEGKLGAIDRKAQSVFREAFPSIQKEAEKTANSLGITRSAFIEASASMTQFFKNTGFTQAESIKLSKQLLEVAGDLQLVDTNGRKTNEIAKDLALSFSGGTKSLRQYGLNIKLSSKEVGDMSDNLDGASNSAKKKGTALKVLNQIMMQTKGITAGLSEELIEEEERMRSGEVLLEEKIEDLARKSIHLKEIWLDIKIAFVDAFNALGYWTDQAIAGMDELFGRGAVDRIEGEGAVLRLTDRLERMFSIIEKNKDLLGVGDTDILGAVLSDVLTETERGQRFINALKERQIKLEKDLAELGSASGKQTVDEEAAQKRLLEYYKQRLALLYKISALNDSIFNERKKREEEVSNTFDKIAQDNKSGLTGVQEGVSAEDRAKENASFTEQRLSEANMEIESVNGLKLVYDELFDSMSSGWLKVAQNSGATKKQLILFEKALAVTQILIDYAVKRFKINAEFALLLANPVTAGAAPAFKATAISTLNSGLALNLALLAAQAIPEVAVASATGNKFAKGVEWLNGAGTSTSDSIPAFLSKGERVVPTDLNKKYWDELSAIHNGHFEELVSAKYIMPQVNYALGELTTGDRLFQGMLMQKWKGENVVMELYKNRVQEKENTKLLIEAVKPRRKSKREW